MKNTALTQKHIDLGAKMVEYAGYNMPVQYSGLKDEHLTVRSAVGVFDVSHMGEFIIRGPEAIDLLQYVTTNDVLRLTPGRAQYSCMPNGKGGIVDDLLVYMLKQDEYLVVVNAANMEKDWNWIAEQNKQFGAEMENISDDTTLLAVQGPKATGVLQKLTDIDLDAVKFYHFTTGKLAGVDDVIISATGYTGAGGFELYFDNAHAEQVWDAIFEAGEAAGIKPAGLGARDTLRLEMGFCLYGNDIDDTTSPIEARLGWITKFTKEFVDHDLLKAQKENGTERKLVGFEMIDKGPVPRQGHDILDAEGNVIGRVTSGTKSPSLGKAIGMGYVPTERSKSGNELFIGIRNKQLKAQTVKLPFLKG